MPLTIHAGSPSWWLSPDIWVSPPGDSSTVVASPIAGQNYEVVVRVWDLYSIPWPGWNLYVCWAIPTPSGPIPLPPNSQQLSALPFGSPVNVGPNSSQLFTFNWTPGYLNGGHECLVAVAYNSLIGGPPSILNADGTDTGQGDYCIAQHNLGILPVGTQSHHIFHYPFQVFNVADEEREFVVGVRQAPLSEIAPFHAGFPGGRKFFERPGKVEATGIFASAHPDRIDLEALTPISSTVKLPPHSHRMLVLKGHLPAGNALLHVTQSFGGRVLGGLSVAVTAEEK
jgi:hypothetical protein